MTHVLPLPAPASTSNGPSVATTASRCAGFRSSSRRSSGDDITRLYPTGNRMRAAGQIVTAGRARSHHPFRFFARFEPGARGTTLAGRRRTMTRKILIVGDNEVVQDVRRQFFEPRFSMQIAGNASHALSIIVCSAPDVVLLDMMPGLDGVSLLKSLREMGVTVPIFIMTGYDSLDV